MPRSPTIRSRADLPSSGKRGKYAQRACNHCRQRKTKCDGKQPTCGTCFVQGHECLWGAESAKKPHNKQYVDGLRNVNNVLEKKNKILEDQVRQLRDMLNMQAPEDEFGYASIAAEAAGSPASSSSDSQDSHGFVKIEDPDDADIAAIAAPMHHLHLRNGDLQLFGPTSVLRLDESESTPPPVQWEVGQSDMYTYVLGQANSTVDWKRYLPEEVPLTQVEHDRILERFFRYFSSWHLRVDERLFLRDMYRVLHHQPLHPPPKLSHYSPMLHNAILSVAAAFADDPLVSAVTARQAFAERARESLEAECDRPTLSAVIGLSILANYHSSRKSPTLGYMYFGISARISQALGLGVDCTPWVNKGQITPEGMRDRNWVFWTTFCQDTTWSLYVGRDFSMSSLASVQMIPLPYSETDNVLRTFSATCCLLQIAREILEVVNSPIRLGARQDPDDLKIAQIDLKLGKWREDLPEDVDVHKTNLGVAQPHQLMLQMTYHWLIIILHRPYYRRRSIREDLQTFEIDHVKLCNKAAMDIMDLATAWRNAHSLRFVPITFIQVVSAAGTVFVLAALQATAGPRLAARRLEEARNMTETAIKFLREVGETFASAAGIAQILRGLLDHQVQDRLNRRGGESPPQPYNDVGSYTNSMPGFANAIAPQVSGVAEYQAGQPYQPSSDAVWNGNIDYSSAQAQHAAYGAPGMIMQGPAAPMFQLQFGFDTMQNMGGYTEQSPVSAGSGDWYTTSANGMNPVYTGPQVQPQQQQQQQPAAYYHGHPGQPHMQQQMSPDELLQTVSYLSYL